MHLALVESCNPLVQTSHVQNVAFFIHVIVHIGVAARAGAPLRRAPGRRRGEAPTREGASGGGRGCGVACASALGREPVGRGRRPRIPFEFPSNSLRREFWSSLRRELEGNSKGDGTLTRRVGHILQPSLIALPRTVARSPSKRNSKKNRRRRAMHSRRRRCLGAGVAVSEGANSKN